MPSCVIRPSLGLLGLLHASTYVHRSSVRADQWQAATLGKTAGKSTGGTEGLVDGRGGALSLPLPLRKSAFFPWRTPSSFQSDTVFPMPAAVLAMGGGRGKMVSVLPGLLACAGQWEKSSSKGTM